MSSSMNQLLAAHFGNAPAQPQADLEKQAQFEIFAKLAAEHNIDLSQYSNEQIAQAMEETFKVADAYEKGEPPHDEKKEHEKKLEAAKEEHEKKKEAAVKIAEATYVGQTMAHSFMATLREEMAKDAAAAAGVVNIQPDGQTKEAAMPEALKKGLEKVRGAGSAVSRHMENVGHRIGGKDTMKSTVNPGKEIKTLRLTSGQAKAVGAGAHAAGAAAVGGGAAAAHHAMKKKESSAVDALAAEVAVEKAAEAGFDPEQAGELIAARFTLGMAESEKIAAAASELSLEQAVDLRAYEILEAVGYPVTWQ